MAKRSTARFDSAACKLKFNRKKEINDSLVKAGLPPTSQAFDLPEKQPFVEIETVEELAEHVFGKVDAVSGRVGGPVRGDLDWPGSPDWWEYGTPDEPSKTWDRVCVKCGKDYTTRLSLMRFCSDACKADVYVVIANGPHPNYVKWAQR